jgi:hypothetical protein
MGALPMLWDDRRGFSSVNSLIGSWLTSQQLEDRVNDPLPDGLPVGVAACEALVRALRGDDSRVFAAVPFDEQVSGTPNIDVSDGHMEV